MNGGDAAAILGLMKATIEFLGTWPGLGIICLIMMGPWIAVLVVVYIQGRRFAAVTQMYENNADLLKWHEGLSGDMKDIIIMNTQAMQNVVGEMQGARTDIKENRFCPVMRIKEAKEVVVEEPTI